jgi:L-rhamnose mutarotase
MWYNVIPPYILLDFSLYPTYVNGTKGFDLLIFKNYTIYVHKKKSYLFPLPKFIRFLAKWAKLINMQFVWFWSKTTS